MGNEVSQFTPDPDFQPGGAAYSKILKLVPGKDSRKIFTELRGSDARTISEVLDKMMDDIPKDRIQSRKQVLHTLSEVVKNAQLTPRSLELRSGAVHCNVKGKSAGDGGFGTVYRGTLGSGQHQQNVCVKVTRKSPRESKDSATLLRAHAKEAIILAHACHLNVLPFYGLHFEQKKLCIVTPWMENGNVMSYLRGSRNRREELQSLLISDTVSGLGYLHGMEIVHADLRGSNVLVSNDKRALIADFGVSRISVTLATTTNLATNLAFWMAPELLLEDDPAKRKPTKASDIWALACTCFEIMTDSKPFEQQFEDRKPNAQNALIREFGKRAWFGPPESQGFPPVSGTEKALWEVFSGCWKYNSRPCIEDIADSVAQLSLADNRPSSGLDDTWQTVAKAARNPRPAVDYKKARSILSRAPGP